jgi:hypothetical protein
MNQRDRVLLEQLEAKYGKGRVIASFLRQEVVLKNQQNGYRFDFNDDNKGKATERRLAKQDLFVANSLGLFLLKEIAGKEGLGLLQTHPAPAVFVEATGVAFTRAHLEAVYNGSLAVRQDNNVIVDKFPTAKFRKRNSQETESHITDGMSEIEPNLVFIGDRKKEVSVEIPTVSGIQIESGVAGEEHKLVLVAFGFLISNAV